MYMGILLIWLVAILQLHGTDCTDCYSCKNVDYVALCHTTIKCPPGQVCYTEMHASKYTLGCRETVQCPTSNSTHLNPGGAGSIVGRTASQPDCSQCCETGMCNRQLCQAIDEECRDAGHIDCVTTGQFVNMCAERDRARQECRRFCGMCNMVDGGWSGWSTWSACSTSCGNGSSKRTRSCSNPAPANGGTSCTGNNHETATCANGKCPVNGGWSNWSLWGSCSVTCGIGMQRRDRSCSHPYPSFSGFHCFGDARDDRVCLAGACHDGGWTNWGNWSTCAQTCDICTQIRTRSCTNPPPSVLGKYCIGINTDTKTSLLKPCARLGYFFTVRNPDPARLGHFSKVITNIGGSFNMTSGQFVCKHHGVYTFTMSLMASRYAIREVYCFILKNGQHTVPANSHSNDGSYDVASNTVFLELNVNDVISIGGCSYWNHLEGDTTFSGGSILLY